MLREYRALSADMRANGVHRASDPLEDSDLATQVRLRDGATILTDGRFMETKEQLAGFYEVECASLAEAIGYAARIPHAATGAVEVRPIADLPGV